MPRQQVQSTLPSQSFTADPPIDLQGGGLDAADGSKDPKDGKKKLTAKTAGAITAAVTVGAVATLFVPVTPLILVAVGAMAGGGAGGVLAKRGTLKNVLENEQRCFEGFLTKRSRHFRKWERRFFVLLETRLVYFKNKEDKEPKGSFIVANDWEVEVSSTSNYPYGFKIESPNERIHLAADTLESREQWIDAILAAIERVKNPSSSPESGEELPMLSTRHRLASVGDVDDAIARGWMPNPAQRYWELVSVHDCMRVFEERDGEEVEQEIATRRIWKQLLNAAYTRVTLMLALIFSIVYYSWSGLSPFTTFSVFSLTFLIFLVLGSYNQIPPRSRMRARRGFFSSLFQTFSASLKVGVPMKASITVPLMPEDVFNLLLDFDRHRPRWDTSVKSGRVLQEIDRHSAFVLLRMQPVIVWPFTFQQRDFLLYRYWRKYENGVYCIFYNSQQSDSLCPQNPDYVRGHVYEAEYSILPIRLPGGQDGSVVTCMWHCNPGGVMALLARLFHLLKTLLLMHHMQSEFGPFRSFNYHMVRALSGVRVYAEQNPTLNESEPGIISEEVVNTALLLDDHEAPDVQFPLPVLDEFAVPPSRFSLPKGVFSGQPHSWLEPDGSVFMVRGPSYLTDRLKISAGPAMFKLLGVDMFESDEKVPHFAAHPESIVQKTLQREEEPKPFLFVVSLQVPDTKKLHVISYFSADLAVLREDYPRFESLLARFVDGDDAYRNSKFKLLPGVVEGSWIVKKSVGNTPAILGKAVDMKYFHGSNYIEVDVDVCTSAVASGVVRIAREFTESLVIDIAYIIEADHPDDLPERVLGSVRFSRLDFRRATDFSSPPRPRRSSSLSDPPGQWATGAQ
eukprot:Rmarinus@m.25902